MTDALFDGYEPGEPPPPLSADRRRTQRQAERVAMGVHPLTGGRLHELASRHRNADAPKNDPFTCGSCWFRDVVSAGNKRFAKCFAGSDTNRAPRATSSVASDVRAWWPACPDYSPGDRISDDAARYVP
jgi:hypothetical protein